MNIQITSDNIKVSSSMKSLTEQKLERLTSKLKDIPEDLIEIRVVLNKGDADGTFISKVALSIAGKMIVGEDSEYNFESALIKAIDDTLRQYNKEKEKADSEEWQIRRELKTFQYEDKDGDE